MKEILQREASKEEKMDEFSAPKFDEKPADAGDAGRTRPSAVCAGKIRMNEV